MGGLIGKLTQSGLQDPNGNVKYYPSQDDTMKAANTALQNATSSAPGVTNLNAPPTNVQVADNPLPLPPGTQGPQDLGAPNVTFNQSAPQITAPITPAAAKNLPTEVHPSFQSLTTDKAGNAVLPNQGLSKLGMLASLLKVSMQGATDAMASGALNAAPGKSGVGAGVAGATELPIMRAQRAADLAKEQAQTQNVQGETALHQAQVPYYLQRGNAYGALAAQRGNLSTKQQLDLATQTAIDNGTSPDLSPDVLQLRAALKAEMAASAKNGTDASPKPLTARGASLDS